MKPALIAFDLDNTFLNTAKTIPEENFAVLRAAHEEGVLIVPSTGRFLDGMPEEVLAMPQVRYAITINGAVVYDLANREVISAISIPLACAQQLMAYLNTQDVIYDCYLKNDAFMSRSLWEKTDEYIRDPYYRQRVRSLRRPVDDLMAFTASRGEDVSKVQLFAKDQALRLFLLKELPRRFPVLEVASSLEDNIEITHRDANKGAALTLLAEKTAIPMARTMAVGDGSNDITMLRCAGRGVAMGNASEEVKAAADEVTADCDHGGFAQAVKRAMGMTEAP